MIKTLQKKFIITAMTAITVLLVILLGAINVINIVSVSNETERTLRVISENEGDSGKLTPPSDEHKPEPPQDNGNGRKNEYDTFMSSNFLSFASIPTVKRSKPMSAAPQRSARRMHRSWLKKQLIPAKEAANRANTDLK